MSEELLVDTLKMLCERLKKLEADHALTSSSLEKHKGQMLSNIHPNHHPERLALLLEALKKFTTAPARVDTNG